MTLNPEFRRYCWLELTPHRVIAAPVIAGLILALVAASTQYATQQSAEALATAGLAGFAVCTLLYGGFMAMNAMPEEIRERTWDFQRMSALTPAQLAVGKVFGAPVAAWYAGAWFLAAYLVAGFYAHGTDALLTAGIAVLVALALHAAAMTFGVFAARAGVTRNPGAVFLLLIFWIGAVPLQWFGGNAREGIVWWGMQPPRLWFWLVSALLLAGWAWLAAARSFAGELRVRQLPWAWPAFCLYLGVWAGGLLDTQAGQLTNDVTAGRFNGVATGMVNRAAIIALVFFVAAGLGAYLLLLSERTGAMTLARVLRPWRGQQHGGITRALQNLPLWSVSLVSAWAGAVLLWLMPWSTGLGGVAAAASGWLADISGQGKVMPLALAAMLLRDAGIYCIFALTRFPHRPAMAAALYIVLLDAVFPLLLSVSGLPTLAFLVFPLGRASAAGALLIFMVQALLAWGIALRRWRAGQQLDLVA